MNDETLSLAFNALYCMAGSYDNQEYKKRCEIIKNLIEAFGGHGNTVYGIKMEDRVKFWEIYSRICEDNDISMFDKSSILHMIELRRNEIDRNTKQLNFMTKYDLHFDSNCKKKYYELMELTDKIKHDVQTYESFLD